MTVGAIHKENRRYIKVISFEYLGAEHYGEMHLDKIIADTKSQLPSGYDIEKIFHKWDFEASQMRYWIIGVLIMLNYFICGILFESVKQPLFIIAILPVSFIGIFLVFGLWDLRFDQGGYASFILLGGIVINSAIFVIHDYNNLKLLNKEMGSNLILIAALTIEQRQ